ncbi:hypothetical protein PFISCL1PPCAC_12104, partial [Pristionchus fissidentatus]
KLFVVKRLRYDVLYQYDSDINTMNRQRFEIPHEFLKHRRIFSEVSGSRLFLLVASERYGRRHVNLERV